MSMPRHFVFTVGDDGKTLRVEREFNASRDLVWAAWTTAELLDQWWAPKPYRSITKSMDFRVGGTWLYYMQGPEGDIHWCLNNYTRIEVESEFESLDAFCNEEGVINDKFPRAMWHATFNDEGENTMVTIVTTYDSKEDLETVLKMGMKEGFTAALENLDELLLSMISA